MLLRVVSLRLIAVLLLGVDFAGLLYDEVVALPVEACLYSCLMSEDVLVIDERDGAVVLTAVRDPAGLAEDAADAAALPDACVLTVLDALVLLETPPLIGVLLVNTLSDPVL